LRHGLRHGGGVHDQRVQACHPLRSAYQHHQTGKDYKKNGFSLSLDHDRPQLFIKLIL
jgi:hypothetical protein